MNQTYKLLIGSEWRQKETNYEIKSPFDGKSLGSMSLASKEDIDDAITSSLKAFKVTREMSRYDRSAILMNIANGIQNQTEDFAETIALEAGKPIKQARREVERAVSTFIIASEEAKRTGGELLPLDIEKTLRNYSAEVMRFPIGPVAAISPFNFPLNLVAHKVAPAIAAGNSVVHKPASNTPITAVKLGRVIEGSGAVPGTYNIIQARRPISELLATDDRIKMLTFTGSAEVGWHLKSLCNKKRVSLELGGNAGVYVDNDCDLKWAAMRCAEGAYAYAGQICISIQRIFVEKSSFNNFVDLFLKASSDLKCGDPLNEETFVGPLIDKDNADRIMDWIDEAKRSGGKVLLGAKREGNVITPTVLTNVNIKCKISAEEAFGPIAIIEPCQNFIEGIERINDSRFGLQAAIFTYDLRKVENAYKNIDVGGVIVNDYPTFRVDNYPYGGVKESGFGREGVRYAMEEMTELKTLVINYNK